MFTILLSKSKANQISPWSNHFSIHLFTIFVTRKNQKAMLLISFKNVAGCMPGSSKSYAFFADPTWMQQIPAGSERYNKKKGNHTIKDETSK